MLEDFFSSIVFDIVHCKRRVKDLLEYHNFYYSALAHQRAQIINDLKHSLSCNTKPFSFENWSRIVTYRFSDHPLSTRGSVLNDPGGRFNIGDIDTLRFPAFPALYVAQDYYTAYKEIFGQSTMEGKQDLSEEDFAFADSSSFSKICIRGRIEHTLDVNSKSSLEQFVQLIRDFRIPKELSAKARALKVQPPRIVSTTDTLQAVLMDPNWRNMPQLVDSPAPSQLFGQIARAAGIEAILYKSKMSNKNCVAVFVDNFQNSSSFVELEGKLPKAVKHCRIDSTTWKSF